MTRNVAWPTIKEETRSERVLRAVHVLYRQIHCCRCAWDVNKLFREQISSCLRWSRTRTFYSTTTVTNVLRSNTVAQESTSSTCGLLLFFFTHSWLEMYFISWVLASVLSLFFITINWASLQLNTKAGPKQHVPYVVVLQRTASSAPFVTDSPLWVCHPPCCVLVKAGHIACLLACVSECLNTRKRLR